MKQKTVLGKQKMRECDTSKSVPNVMLEGISQIERKLPQIENTNVREIKTVKRKT